MQPQQTVDLSHALHEGMQIYPGDPQFTCCPALSLDADGWNVQSLSLGTHTGTHVDAPYHIIKDGQTIDALPISRFVGPVIVIDVTDVGARHRIVWNDIANYESTIQQGADRGAFVFFRTNWSHYYGSERYFDHTFLDKAVAQKLVDYGIHLIGVDTLSPDETHLQPNENTPEDVGVHQTILGAGGIIAENLTNLASIEEGEWIVHLAPLKLKECDGSPVRAYAVKTSD
ncbi:putative cyclase [Panus rudis PR-1116 ss-1]|nr:putative cyclase [Panus rudis PR-1116 ss-1]